MGRALTSITVRQTGIVGAALLVAVLLALAALLLQPGEAQAQAMIIYPGRDDAAWQAYHYCSEWYKYNYNLYPYQTDSWCNWYANTYWSYFYGRY
jgi:hypothetical protein